MLFKKKEKEELILILDLQSAMVRVSLLRIAGTSLPEIIFTNSKKIPYRTRVDAGHLIKMAIELVHELIGSALIFTKIPQNIGEDHNKHISRIEFVLSSPWGISQARTIKRQFDKETFMSSHVVNEILSSENKNLGKQFGENITVFEQKVFEVKLNGYSVSSWQDKKTNEICISYGFSVAGKETIKNLIDLGESLIPHVKIGFHSALLLQYTGSKIVLDDPASYALVHIHGESTDIAIVEDHICNIFDHFPIGFNSIIRNIAHITKNTPSAVDSLISLYIGGHIDTTQDRVSEKAIEDASLVWVNELKQVLSKTNVKDGFISKIMVSSRIHENFFVRCLEKNMNGGEIGALSLETIKSFINFDRKTEQSRSMGLYAIAIVTLNHSPNYRIM